MDNGQLKMDNAGAVTAVPKGYKQTEVGVIPGDWRQVKIRDVAIKIGSGVTPTGGSQRYVEYGRPFVRSQNVGWGQFLLDDLAFIDQATHEEFSGTELKLGDVLLNITGASIGRSALVDATLVGGNVNQHVCIVRVNAYEVIPGFVNRLLLSSLGQRQIDSFQAGGNREGLNFSQVGSIKIPLPPTRTEQEAIAEALSDADALIESLEQLLAKKRQIKQGAMQDLLTGKHRLPGFGGEWRVRTLLDLADGRKELFDDGDWIESEHITDAGIRLVQTGNIGVGCFLEKDDRKYIFESSFVSLRCKEVSPGDLLICRLADPAGRACVLPDIGEAKIVTSVDVTIFRPPERAVNRVFLSNVFSASDWFQKVSDRSGGTTHKRIARGALGQIPIRLPCVEEQTAIATILSDMDAEIAQLESRLAKARQIKQGMMQELLTGRIRLVKKPDAKVIPLPKRADKTGHNQQIEEAAILGVLTQLFGTGKHPLARVRRTKLLYLLQRHLGQQTDAYLKKAAGPYKPSTRYKGPESIAVKNGYVRVHHNGTYEGFVPGDKAIEAKAYVVKWHGTEALDWLEQFRFKKTDELELLGTVDMAVQDLGVAAKPVTMAMVKQVIKDHPEWEAKLDRDIFSDQRIEQAIKECQELFS